MVTDAAPTKRGFWGWLMVWTAVGFAIRLASVIGRPGRTAGGDPGYAHGVANLLVAGKGFINPFIYNFHQQHHVVQTAGWPPLWTFVLTVPIFFGFHTFFAARIWSCVIGAGAVMVCGLAGREVAGRRVGLLTALIIAIYPNIWMNVELASSEVLSPLLVALVLWMAYRFWHRPSFGNVMALGASIGLGVLGRDEIALLMALILLPLVLIAESVTWRRRLGLLVAGGAMAAVVVLPWVGYNLTRFDSVVTVSDGLGPTLMSSNCDVTYSGFGVGYWSWLCIQPYHKDTNVDESVNMAREQTLGLAYIRHHERQLPGVELARIGRGFALFRPTQQVQFDSILETRPYHWALTGLGMYYALLALSIGGSVVLRKRKIPIFPLWAIALDVASVFALSFGQTRYRVTFEVTLAILASVQLEWLWSRVTGRHRRGAELTGAGPVVEATVEPTGPGREPAQLIGGGSGVRG